VPNTGRRGEDKLVRLERDLMQAVRKRDLDFCERTLGEEFTLTTGRPGAEVRDREEWLAVTGERYELESFEFESIEPRVYGHVALVHTRHRQRGRLDGDDRTGSYLTSDLWVRRAGCWQLVARHASPLAPAPGS
jgi:hypothetical protein